MKTPLISVIVPVFNAQNWLKECVSSVLCQTFCDWELILIDDGSTDSSGNLCEEYASSDNRIRVFHKSNEGVSSARNYGLEKALGEWVIFLDSDDFWLSQDTLSVLISTATANIVDVVRGNYTPVDMNGNILPGNGIKRKQEYCGRILNSGIFLKECVAGEYFSVLWLIRKKCIGNLRINKSQVFLEDMRFLMELTFQPLKCIYIDFPFYAYRKYDSIGSSNPNIKRLGDSFGMCDFFWNLAKKQCPDTEYHTICLRNSVMMYCWTIRTVADENYFNQCDDIIAKFKLKTLRKESLKRAKTTGLSINTFERILLHVSPKMAVKFIRIYRKTML